MAELASAGFKRMAREFHRRAGRGPSTEALEGIAALSEGATIDRMDAGQTPEGTPHEPLSATWLAMKEHLGKSLEIWQFSGQSRQAVLSSVESDGTIVTVINTPYSGHAEELRPVLGLSSAEELAIAQILADDINRDLEAIVDGG